jgi:hypothetical protein
LFFWKTTENGSENKMRNFKENSTKTCCLPSQWAMLGTTDSINGNCVLVSQLEFTAPMGGVAHRYTIIKWKY